MASANFGVFNTYAEQYSICGILRDGATVNGYFVLANNLVSDTANGNVSLLAENIKITGTALGETFNYTYGLYGIANTVLANEYVNRDVTGTVVGAYTNFHYTLQEAGINSFTGPPGVTSYVGISALDLDFDVKVNNLTGAVTAKLTSNSGLDLGTYNYDTYTYAPTYAEAAALDGAPIDFNTTLSSLRATAVICYAKGTFITTARGMVAVEKLKVGDLILTVSGKHEPLKWLGFRTVDCKRHPNQAEAHPVRIAKDAFAPNQPMRDLYLSPLHSVYVDGILIPAIDLVNGNTITQEVRSKVTYFHVELPTHNAIFAEGLTAESYLDDNNRDFFVDKTSGQVVDMSAQFAEKQFADMTSAEIWAAKGFAKVMRDGPQVEAVRNKLRRQHTQQESQASMEMAA